MWKFLEKWHQAKYGEYMQYSEQTDQCSCGKTPRFWYRNNKKVWKVSCDECPNESCDESIVMAIIGWNVIVRKQKNGTKSENEKT
jgi:hypothetical protein